MEILKNLPKFKKGFVELAHIPKLTNMFVFLCLILTRGSRKLKQKNKKYLLKLIE